MLSASLMLMLWKLLAHHEALAASEAVRLALAYAHA